MFGWLSEASSCASRLKRASRSGSSGEEFGQDFQRDVATELRVARAIDLAHPACAEAGQNLVAADLSAAERPACILSHDLRRHLQRRGCEEPFCGAFVREQGFHFPPQGVIALTRLGEEPPPLVRRPLPTRRDRAAKPAASGQVSPYVSSCSDHADRDRQGPIEPGVPRMVDLAPAARAGWRDDFVRAEPRTLGAGHRGQRDYRGGESPAGRD